MNYKRVIYFRSFSARPNRTRTACLDHEIALPLGFRRSLDRQQTTCDGTVLAHIIISMGNEPNEFLNGSLRLQMVQKIQTTGSGTMLVAAFELV